MGKRSLLQSFHRSKFDNLADWTNHLELARTKFSKNTIGSLIFILWNCCFGGIRLQIQTKEKNSYQFQSSIFAVKSMTVEFLQNSAQNYGQKSGRKISPLRLLKFIPWIFHSDNLTCMQYLRYAKPKYTNSIPRRVQVAFAGDILKIRWWLIKCLLLSSHFL